MTFGRVARVFSASALFSAWLAAQTVSGSLVGTVIDPAGAVVPAAQVKLTDVNTGATRQAVTDGSGVFRFPNIPPDDYTVSVELKGFKSLVQSGIMVGA